MGNKVALKHRTQYLYDKAVSLGPQVIQLRPAPHARTPVLSYSLRIVPEEHVLHWQLDVHHNRVARVLFPGKTKEFVVEVEFVADLVPGNPFDFVLEPSAESYPFDYAPELVKELEPYRAAGAAGPLLRAFVGRFALEKRATVDLLVDLNGSVRDAVKYVSRMDHGVQSSEETLEKGSGSCRDSAWLLVQTLRRLGFAARFVSGYLIQLADEGADARESVALKEDSAEFHAWAEVFLPGAGWIGFDPTSGLLAGEGHIPLVCTPTPSRAAAIEGTVEPANVEFRYSISLHRLDGPASTAEPFRDEDWARVERVAHAVDADLMAQDVRLTMGGEPTFVGVDDPESPQWNIEALGALKRTRGLELIRCLRDRVAPGALLHFGQGKWYPGEPLPRWALSCCWREDGVPVWENEEWIAREEQQLSLGVADAKAFIEALARRLQVSPENALPAFDAADAPEPAGYILPIRRRQPGGTLVWSSQPWFPQPERLVLSPGDSPIGYRIPTDAMPWVAPDDLEYEMEGEPFADRVKLPSTPIRRMDLFGKEPVPDALPAISKPAETAWQVIRPSLCVQAREGRLHVFLPYVARLPDYLDLVAAVEDTCQYLRKPIWLEGYTPAPDPRLRSFSLTPDPGVLEVNLPPSGDWEGLERVNTILFEEARKNRLTAEKFNHDGGHLATGGGSHIVVGGATVADSPFLRRPDLLRSLVSFWQNHPSLSYLFSGMYVGPTSQYPRVDEARMDALYELEVAFHNLPSQDCPPHVLDGFLRNLLVDVTGNTHRAEFCVDKLYPPEGQGLRLGLLELRAFEMAPDVKMGLIEMLLVRALISTFWKRPHPGGLIRWGTALHDRFMLPHFVWQDFVAVLAELRRAGYDFEDGWFASHWEFRFPKIGSIAVDGVEMELRQALEPWNVLAEETTSGRTFRSVDSSLERLQVKLSGAAADSRYIVACNGRRVPLTATGAQGQAVAGVRYRVRQWSASLHPTIPLHVPLAFDLIDTWEERNVGQCTWHATHPDGVTYTSRPQYAAEAEKRRRMRFRVSEPPQGPAAIPPEERNASFPTTLDLRMPPATRNDARSAE